MPKKTKKDEEEVLKELAEELKKNLNEDQELEESGLEEDVELNTLNFDSFIQPIDIEDAKAPVLERIAGAQPGPIFVGGISRSPQTIPGEEEKSSDFKYVPGQEGNDEPKYLESSSRISTEPERVNFATIGRDRTEFTPQNQEAFFRSSELNSQGASSNWQVEQADVEKAGREDPFKRQETKHKKYEPGRPKGY